MATTAAEIMERDFVHASQGGSVFGLLRQMDDRHLGSAPVLDGEGRPVGSATVRELESCHDIEELADHLTLTAVSVDQNTSIEAAARALAEQHADSLVLVNERGVAVGVLSALDLLRAVLGLNAGQQDPTKPAAAKREVAWRHAGPLEVTAAHRAPEEPGIILLSSGVDAETSRPVWVEPSLNIRERLDQMLRAPQDDPALEALLAVYPRALRFRCLVVHDAQRRARLARALRKLSSGHLALACAGADRAPSVSACGGGSA